MRKSGVPPAVLRCTLSNVAPGPVMMTLLRSGSAELRVIVLFAGRLKVIVLSPPAELVS
jgi:hypothetical protein